jgi:hypothetical protein
MLRRGAQVLARFGTRSISSSRSGLEEAAVAAGPKEFAELWEQRAPQTLDLPQTTTSFMPEASPAAEGDKFTVNFFTPHGVISEAALVRILSLRTSVPPHIAVLFLRCVSYPSPGHC